MSTTRQIVAVVSMNTRAMRSRVAASLVIVVGMAAVVTVALSIYSMSAGLKGMASRGASPDRMIIFSQGAIDGGPSNIPRDAVLTIADTPGIMKGPDDKPVVAGEIAANYITTKKENGVDVFVTLRGTNPNVLTMRPGVKLVEGRMFRPGLREIIAGSGAVARFDNVALGNQIILANGPWTIVGIIKSSSSFDDYALMADADTLMASLRGSTYNHVFARLQEGTKAAQDQFKAALKSNPALSVDVETEEESFTRNLKSPTQFYASLAYGVGTIMALGVIFAALNTLYAAVSARITEIATLRAIGFGATPVVISIVVEALALATFGAIIGALLAWVGSNGRDQNYGPIAISLTVTPTMMMAGIVAALIVGAIGGLFPAIRAARLPVATALQVR